MNSIQFVGLPDAVRIAAGYDKDHSQHSGYDAFIEEFSSVYDRAVCGEFMLERLRKSHYVVDLIAVSSRRRELAFVEFKWCITSGATIRRIVKKVRESYELLQEHLRLDFKPESYRLLVVVERSSADNALMTMTDVFREFIRRGYEVSRFTLRMQLELG